MAEQPKKPITQVKDPMVQMGSFIDAEGDPEAELKAREAAATQAAGEAPAGDSSPQEGTPEAPPDQAPAEGEESLEEPAEQQATGEEPPPEKRQLKPWERVKQLREENRALNERLAAIEQREQQRQAQEQAWRQQQEQERLRQQQGQQPQFQIPDYQEDPLGHINARLQLQEAQNQVTAQQLAVARLTQKITSDEQTYAQTADDYYNARNYLVEREYHQARAMGLADQDILGVLEARRQVVIGAALRSGRSVAEVVYEMAKVAGYQRPEGQQQAAKTNGAQQRVQQAAARERQAGAALANVPTTPGETPRRLTRGMIEKMSEAELDAFDRQHPGTLDQLTRD